MGIKILLILSLLFSVSAFSKEYKWKHKGKIQKIYMQSNVQIDFEKAKRPKIVRRGQGSKNALSIMKASPVFSDNPNGEGRLRALPGGIVLKFIDSYTDEDVKNWAKDNGVTLIRKYSRKNTWLIDSPTGLETLNISNALDDRPEIEAASPDWWVNVKQHKELKPKPKKN